MFVSKVNENYSLFPCDDQRTKHLLYILEHYQYGCHNIPGDFHCASDCRKKDFIERPRFTSISDSCAREKGGGCSG